MYERWTDPKNIFPWFSLFDCLYRYSLTVVAYYWNLVTQPFNLFYYTFRYGQVWYNLPTAIIMALSYPILPVLITALVIGRNIKDLFVHNWMSEGPGSVFFVRPSNPIASLLWDMYITQSMFIG
jgi:hypothetical protein